MIDSTINFLKSFFSFKGRIGRLYYFAYTFTTGIYGTYVTSNNNVSDLFHLIFIILFIKHTLVLMQRLHDLNINGWWFIFYYIFFPPLLLLVLCFFKGTPTANEYGEPPSY
jgi:uncharacterized membrane protein YhaH (DUF805 family)